MQAIAYCFCILENTNTNAFHTNTTTFHTNITTFHTNANTNTNTFPLSAKETNRAARIPRAPEVPRGQNYYPDTLLCNQAVLWHTTLHSIYIAPHLTHHTDKRRDIVPSLSGISAISMDPLMPNTTHNTNLSS